MGFGIAAIIFAVIAVVAILPFNLIMIWVALLSATVAAGSRRGGGLALATWLLCAVNLLVLSPLTAVAYYNALKSTNPQDVAYAQTMSMITGAAFLAPIIGAFFRRRAVPAENAKQQP